MFPIQSVSHLKLKGKSEALIFTRGVHSDMRVKRETFFSSVEHTHTVHGGIHTVEHTHLYM